MGNEKVGSYMLGTQVRDGNILVKWVDMWVVEVIGRRVVEFSMWVRVLGNLGRVDM